MPAPAAPARLLLPPPLQLLAAPTPAGKDKWVAELKKEVKRLQKRREAVRAWAGGELPGLKDDAPLHAARRLVEIEMVGVGWAGVAGVGAARGCVGGGGWVAPSPANARRRPFLGAPAGSPPPPLFKSL